MIKLIFAAVLAAMMSAAGAATIDLRDNGSTFVMPEWRVGTTLPPVCNVGLAYFKTDATAGQNLYYCTATNTWTQQVGGGAGSGNVTGSGLTSGQLIAGAGGTAIAVTNLSGDVVTTGSAVTAIASNAVTTAKIADANVTLAKIVNVSAASKLLGRGDSGAGVPQEITIGSGLTMTGTTLSSSGGSGTPGGSSGQIQYNSSGTFAGFTMSGDGTLNTGTGALTVTLPINHLATIAPNTVLANVTSGTAVPTAFAVANCAVLQWITNTGFACNTALPPAAIENIQVNSVTLTPDPGAINFIAGTGITITGGTFASNTQPITIAATGGSGTVTTSGSPANGNLAKFSGATAITNGDLSGDISTTGTLVTTIGAGKVTEAMQVTADNTTQNVSSTKHGYAPKSPADATQFLNGAATPAYAAVKDSDLSTTDITTNNATTSKHGFVPKLPNDATKYYDGTGSYSVPAGTGGGSGGGTDGWSSTTISLAVNATQYTPFSGGGPDSATEANVQSAIGAAATISGLYVNLDAALGGSATLTVTLRNAGVDTALTCVTASGGSSCNDTTHSVNVAKGDLLSFKIVAGGTVTSATPSLKINFATGTSGVGVTSVATTSPITGGTISTTGTIACATCVTSAASLTNGQLVAGAGSQGTAVTNLSGDATTSGSAVVTVAKVNGIAYSGTAAAHSVQVTTTANTTVTAKVIPDCTDTGGNHLNFTQSTDAFSCGTSGSGGGSGTVTNTGGNLTSNAVVLGAGTVDTKVVAGLTTDGTARYVAGANSGTAGTFETKGSTSGSMVQQNAAAAMLTSVASWQPTGDTLSVSQTINCVLDANQTGTDDTNVHPIFGFASHCSTNGAFQVAAATTYEFELAFALNRTGGTGSHTISLSFVTAASASFTSIGYRCWVSSTAGTGLGSPNNMDSQVATATVISNTSASSTENFRASCKGHMRINAGGTVAPSFQYNTTTPGGAPVIPANITYFKAIPIGTNTMVTNGTWN